jgi:hypothetical protein
MEIKNKCKECGNEINNTKSHHPIVFCSNECKFNFRMGNSNEANKIREKISNSKIGHSVSIEARKKWR